MTLPRFKIVVANRYAVQAVIEPGKLAWLLRSDMNMSDSKNYAVKITLPAG